MRIENSVEVPHSREQTWQRLVHEGGLKSWLGADQQKLIFFEGDTFLAEPVIDGENIEVVGETALLLPPEKIDLVWMEQRSGRDLWPAPTRVFFDLETLDTGTRIKITHEGFEHMDADQADRVYQRYRKYWQHVIIHEGLKSIFEPGMD